MHNKITYIGLDLNVIPLYLPIHTDNFDLLAKGQRNKFIINSNRFKNEWR